VLDAAFNILQASVLLMEEAI